MPDRRACDFKDNIEKTSKEIEFLNIQESGSKLIESLSFIKTGVQEELKSKLDNTVPPWKRCKVPFKSDIIKRAQEFLQASDSNNKTLNQYNDICNDKLYDNIGDQQHVIMDVHLGVFNVDGNVLDEPQLLDKGIVTVSLDNINTSDISEYKEDMGIIIESELDTGYPPNKSKHISLVEVVSESGESVNY
ncbi:uncharacterized protein CMU_010190 [Cryptosporidium muris RN66]|uniref:Uncharacterized protein n=1 Tax=Cryptosporidium muris (strain RN66) TaxID=441375 RepID=B6AE86_CRYMR|nr:uncharacterized protein CMU_010190 [Cryptosporidium muris RN66]EEA06527.1 hypothetical protein, conserved [Cryptosporidium muris RN66]|eukprot:XP_002140876.1 hypothetical protein [Cryptosporidium muris RN66]